MKLLKVKIVQTHSDGVTHHAYPSTYDSRKIQVMGYGEDGIPVEPYCIGWVTDVAAPEFLKSKDIVELNRDDAVTILEKWNPQTIKITDENKVMQVCAKVVLAVAEAKPVVLLQEEKDALNADSPVSGINKTRPMNEIVDELLAQTDLG